MPKTLEFFFDYGSPYSYLAATQVEAVAARTSARLQWRPFLLGAVFQATGNISPRAIPVKVRHLVVDIERWAKHYGLPPVVHAIPENTLKPDRLGLVAIEQGKIAEFTRAVYEAAFVHGKDVSTEPVLAEALAAAGMDPAASFARAENPEIKQQLRQNTEEAIARGAFGAPVFFVGDEMFVGNDRLVFVEQALRG